MLDNDRYGGDRGGYGGDRYGGSRDRYDAHGPPRRDDWGRGPPRGDDRGGYDRRDDRGYDRGYGRDDRDRYDDDRRGYRSETTLVVILH